MACMHDAMKHVSDTVFDFGLICCALFVAGAWSVSHAFAPLGGEAGVPVLVLAAPWGEGAAQIAERGGGSVIGPDKALFGALATFEDTNPKERLLRLGAWAVRDGQSLAQFCGGREI